MYKFNREVLVSIDRNMTKRAGYEHCSLVEQIVQRDKSYQYNLGIKDDKDDMDDELRKQQDLGRKELPEKVFREGLNTLGRTASGVGYAYLGLNLQDQGIFTIIVPPIWISSNLLGNREIQAHPASQYFQ